MKSGSSLVQCLTALSIGLGIASSLQNAHAQVEHPAANANQATQGMGAAGGGRNQTVPPEAAVAADPRNFNGMWTVDSGVGAGGGAGMGAGGAPGAAGGGPPGGAAPSGAAAPNGAPGGGGLPNDAGPGGKSSKLLCIPQGSVFAGGVGGVQFIQTDNQLNIVAEENHRVRRIYIGVDHPKTVTPSYMGHSVGRWDGSTLVIDTVGVKTTSGVSNTRTIERLSKKDQTGTVLEIRTTTIDASGRATEGRPMSLNWTSGRDVAEWICEDYSDEFFSDDYK